MIIPPNDTEAEQSLLGSIIIDPDCLIDCELNENDFYEEKNKIVFQSIQDIRKKNGKIDLISIKSNLESKKNLSKIGGITYLSDLIEIVPISTNFSEYQKIIKEKSKLRQVLNLLYKINKKIYEENNSDDIICDLYSKISKIENDSYEKKDMGALYEETIDYIEQIKNQELVGLSYGKEFKYLDIFTGGIQLGNIVRIGGGSNVGKTWLLYNFLLEILKIDDRITFFSLENAGKFSMKNLCGLKKGINSLPENIRRNNIDFTSELTYFYGKENFVLDTDTKNLKDIFRKTLKNKSKYIFIDYLQLIQVDEGRTRNEKLIEYAFQIQAFAKKYKITVFDLSQISNEVNRGGVNSRASTEFMGAGELKSSADLGLHVFENEARMQLKESCIENGETRDFYKNFVYIKISKNRLGPGAGKINDHIIDFSEGGKYLFDNLENI